MVGEIDKIAGDDEALTGLREALVDRLFDEVKGMSLDNFIVRPKRLYIEKYARREAWETLGLDARDELTEHVAGLPSAFEDDDLGARQFDNLMLQTQIALLRVDPALTKFKARVMAVAARLEELRNVPMVAAQMALILEVQTEEFWQDVTLPLLENLRKKLRLLVKLIEPGERNIVYTDFEDEIGAGEEVALPNVGNGTDKARFLMKARHFLKQHENHIAILKLRRDEQLTPQDLTELERMFVAEAVASPEELARIRDEGGLGLFVRSLVGLDREAAKKALDGFVAGRTLTANQIEFIDLIIDHLTESGVMEPTRLYESPFTDLADQGVGGLFPPAEVMILVETLKQVKARTAA